MRGLDVVYLSSFAPFQSPIPKSMLYVVAYLVIQEYHSLLPIASPLRSRNLRLNFSLIALFPLLALLLSKWHKPPLHVGYQLMVSHGLHQHAQLHLSVSGPPSKPGSPIILLMPSLGSTVPEMG